MADSGRGPKDSSRRRSSKQLPKSSQIPPSASRSRPKSDVLGSTSRNAKPNTTAGRPLLQDRTHSEPVETADAGAPSNASSLRTLAAHSETFLLRPSIDHSDEAASSSSEFRLSNVRGNMLQDGVASGEDLARGMTREHIKNTPTRSIIRIVGVAGSGKSTFVQQYHNALGRRRGDEAMPSGHSRDSEVILQELEIGQVNVLDDGRIIWPGSLEIQKEQAIRGVVVLYDVMDRPSFVSVQKIIKALSDTSIPAALVASKCDQPPEERVVNPDVVEERVKTLFEHVRLFRMSRLPSDSPRACVSFLLDNSRTIPTEHATTSAESNAGSGSCSRQTSPDFITQPLPIRTKIATPDSEPVNHASFKLPKRRSDLEAQLHIETSLAASDIAGERSPRSFLDFEDLHGPNDGSRLETDDDLRVTRSAGFNQPAEVQSPTDSAVTFNELTTKLLFPTSAKADAKFIATFLTFYRFFAPPLSLLDAIAKHFDAHDGNVITPWVHEPILERDLNIIDRWINVYPGDFAKLATRQKLQKLLARVATEHGVGEDDGTPGLTDGPTLVDTYGNIASLAASASQISLALNFVGEDDDTDWGYSDSGPFRRSRSNTFLSMSSLDSQVDKDNDGSSRFDEPLSRVTSTNPAYDAKLIFGGQSTRTLTAMGRSRQHPDSGSSSQTLLNFSESAQRQAALLSPKPTQTFGKMNWRAFMAHPDDQIARELTRIDWIMFSSIRPRDLVRHVTIPAADRGRFNALGNVSRMIDHFNHVAYWVTNVVLFRDKPKHRAQALEKFMRVARKLRELNNYNSLGAIIAGTQGTSVHRLKATKDLVSPNVQKDFMKLEILLAATKGHWAYRLAWENTRSERVPFLPLHRRDLAVAEAGGKTFVGGDMTATSPTADDASDSTTIQQREEIVNTSKLENGMSPSKISLQSQSTSQSPSKSKPWPGPNARINWRKFDIMGEILETLTQAQMTPYVGFTANEEIRSLVLDHVIAKDDDDLYERSMALEPPMSTTASGASSGLASSTAGPAVRKMVKDRMAQLMG